MMCSSDQRLYGEQIYSQQVLCAFFPLDDKDLFHHWWGLRPLTETRTKSISSEENADELHPIGTVVMHTLQLTHGQSQYAYLIVSITSSWQLFLHGIKLFPGGNSFICSMKGR